jgi:hypothetical protein
MREHYFNALAKKEEKEDKLIEPCLLPYLASAKC